MEGQVPQNNLTPQSPEVKKPVKIGKIMACPAPILVTMLYLF